MIQIDGNSLTIEQVVAVARNYNQVNLTDNAIKKIKESRSWVDKILESGKPTYGINTGFGIFADKKISRFETENLNRNLILSHAVATGEPLSEEVVRAAILVRANTLAKGYSGIRLEIVQRLIDMLNHRVTPVIPSQGSLGSSGDLAQLSHMALVLTTDQDDNENESGHAVYDGDILSGKQAMDKAGLSRIILQAKEGLALNNGATFSAAIAALSVYDSEILLETASTALAMSLEALLGVSTAFDPRLHEIRNQLGQIAVAERVRVLIDGSTFVDSNGHVQDAYSLRCAPQVQGAAQDAIKFINQIVIREINAATDNPLLFGPTEAISGGNFHGEPIGMVMDFLGIALTEIGGISERRIFRLTDGNLNAGLPPMLVDKPQDAGLNSGMMMTQYTAASLILENQALASPDSVYSLPTSAEKEDHNANAMTAARHGRQIIQNTAHVLAIELYCAARALTLRQRDEPGKVMGKGVEKAYLKLRDSVPYTPGDALWNPEIDTIHEMVASGAFSKL